MLLPGFQLETQFNRLQNTLKSVIITSFLKEQGKNPMQKIILTTLLAFVLAGCVHKMDIEQGNIVTREMLAQIHPGISEQSTKEILGPPLLMNTFADNRADYVYTFKPGYGKETEKYITLIFKNQRLQEVAGNRYSQFMQ